MSQLASLYQAIFDPKTYDGGLPIDSGAPVIHKDVSIYGVFTPGQDVFNDGFLLWNIYRGYNSMLLCNTIGPTVSFNGNWTLGNSVVPVSVGFVNPTYPVMFPFVTQLSISPELSQTISMGRLACGMIKMYSATTSTTSAALTGQLAAAAITDVRNLTTWLPPDMSQNAFTSKDAVSNVKASEGVVSIVGPDINTELTAIDKNLSIAMGDQSYQQIRFAPQVMSTSAAVNNVFAMTTGLNGTGTALNIVDTRFPPIFPGMSFRIRFVMQGTQATTGYLSIDARVGAIMQKINGGNTTLFGLGDLNVYSQVKIHCNSFAGCISTSEWIEFNLQGSGFGQTAARCLGVGFEYQSTTTPGNFAMIGYDVAVMNAYDLDNIGSYRVMRWDNITQAQTLNIMGVEMVDGIPSGSIAPYVKADSRPPTGVGSVLPDLRYLFANPITNLKRIYTFPEYLLAKSDRGKDYEAVESLPETTHTAAGMYGAAGRHGAAGMYGAKGKYSAGLFGDIGGTLGNMAGSAIDDVTGAIFGASGTRKRARGVMQI